jgi:hypothetical protein
MKKDKINLVTIEIAKVWQPTCNLRWFESNVYCPMRDEFKKTLQQMWTSNLGDIEWKDIPVENKL